MKTSFPRLCSCFLIAAALTILLNGCAVKQPVPSPSYPKKKTSLPPASRPLPTYPQPTYPQPPPPQPPAPEPAEPVASQPPPAAKMGAGGSLYSSAQDAMARGNYQQAEMMLERALKIEPRNPHYWYTMAEVKYSQGQYAQAIHLCSKSKSLAARDSQLLRLNDSLSAKARQRL